MRPPHRRSGLVSWVTLGFVLAAAASAGAQGRAGGEVTDTWDNPLEGATVLAEPTRSGGPQTTTTGNDGRFQFVGLASGDWTFTATLDGYRGVQQVAAVTQLGNPRPMNFELSVLATGGRFRERTEFEAEGGTPRFRFEEDGTFEFEDAEGEGEGTYGIVELAAILIVRDYDGPDDKFAITTPVVVEFSDQLFTSLTLDGVVFQKQ